MVAHLEMARNTLLAVYELGLSSLSTVFLFDLGCLIMKDVIMKRKMMSGLRVEDEVGAALLQGPRCCRLKLSWRREPPSSASRVCLAQST